MSPYYESLSGPASVAMRKTIAATICTVLLVSTVNAHNYCPKAECEKTKQKIRQLESKMRQGYTRAQGEKWRSRLRELRAVRSKQCR